MDSIITLEPLLADSRMKGTKFNQSGVTISTNKEKNEDIIFYFIDDPNSNPKIRNFIQPSDGFKIVDLIIHYFHKKTPKILYLYSDGKGNTAKTACKQVINTHKKILSYCKNENIDSNLFFWGVIIVQGNSSHGIGGSEKDDLIFEIEQETNIPKSCIFIIKDHGPKNNHFAQKLREVHKNASNP